jgi:hypothetical protein
MMTYPMCTHPSRYELFPEVSAEDFEELQTKVFNLEHRLGKDHLVSPVTIGLVNLGSRWDIFWVLSGPEVVT